MNVVTCRRFYYFSAAALLLVAGYATPCRWMNQSHAFPSPSSSRRNLRRAPRGTRADIDGHPRRAAEVHHRVGARYAPENMKLNIRVTNVDLAGDFELFRGPQADQVRITKGLYAPHIVLEIEVVDSAAKVVRSGKRDLTDLPIA